MVSAQNQAEFFSQFKQQTDQAYGDATVSNYKTVAAEKFSKPVEVQSQTVVQNQEEGDIEEEEEDNSMEKQALSEVIAASVVTEEDNKKEIVKEDKQVLSHMNYAPKGDKPPPGHTTAACCYNCVYYCAVENTQCCSFYQFPTSYNYVCDSFESFSDISEDYFMSESSVYKFSYRLSDLDNTFLEMLTDSINEEFLVSVKQRGIEFDPQDNNYYIFDDHTSRTALALSPYLTDQKDLPTLIKLTSKFIPEEANTFKENLKQQFQLHEESKVPTQPKLFKLAATLSYPDKDAYAKYEELYEWKHGTKDFYQLSTLSNDQNKEGQKTEDVKEELINDKLYELAERRVNMRSSRLGVEPTKEEILTEYNRVVEARSNKT